MNGRDLLCEAQLPILNWRTSVQAEQELTRALKMVIDAFTDLGFEDHHILGLVNLIINKHITDTGEFTKQYEDYARQTLNIKKELPLNIITIAQG